jgi:hypothetical protein
VSEQAGATFFIGWDVGGWNCDKNPNSRDAIVVLDESRHLVGKPWRGNLRQTINGSHDTADWIAGLLGLCGVSGDPHTYTPVVMGIDTPLGFSTALADLMVHGKAVSKVANSATNPYLFRQTEQFLFQRGLTPLSAIKDMIGSQATKGMHVLARFAPEIRDIGVWTDGNRLAAIEAYPSACKSSATMNELKQAFIVGAEGDALQQSYLPGLDHSDHQDALTCALIAWLFHHQPDKLAQPFSDTPVQEGWIFVPADGLKYSAGE